MKLLRTNKTGLFAGPIFVNGNEYAIDDAGFVQVPNPTDADKMQKCGFTLHHEVATKPPPPKKVAKAIPLNKPKKTPAKE